MNIGVIINQVGGIDGVSLEAHKWITVLEKLGHKAYILTGATPKPYANTTVLPDLSRHHPFSQELYDDIFVSPLLPEDNLIKDLDTQTEKVETIILTWIQQNNIDALLLENVASNPTNICLGWAITRLLTRTNLAAIAHHHVADWNTSNWPQTSYPTIRRILKQIFPIQLPQILHIVSNKTAQKQLKKQFGIASISVPDVMPLTGKYGQVSESTTKTIKTELKIPKRKKILLYASPIIRGKQFEMAVEITKRLGKDFHLLITSTCNEENDDNYLSELKELIKEEGMSKQITIGTGRFGAFSKKRVDDPAVFSLSDAYGIADICLFFGESEGFGHQVLEAIAAKKPFVTTMYPAYETEIATKGIKGIYIKKNKVTAAVISDIYAQTMEKGSLKLIDSNFEIALGSFHISKLEEFFRDLFQAQSILDCG
ncbi:glycosyltransferase [bacterium]|jgi:mannosylglucosylglycerate synthase|nr:glycosyltransferase [bacterium]